LIERNNDLPESRRLATRRSRLAQQYQILGWIIHSFDAVQDQGPSSTLFLDYWRRVRGQSSWLEISDPNSIDAVLDSDLAVNAVVEVAQKRADPPAPTHPIA
jgi:hypothetical protein